LDDNAKQLKLLDLRRAGRPGLWKTGGKGGAVFGLAFDQKPAAMTNKYMFHQG
jgi:hypothetical protein